MGPQLGHERVAPHHRHHDVAQDQVRPQLERPLQPLTTVESRRHPVVWRETIDQEPAHLRIVLEHEDETSAAAPADRDGRLASRLQLRHRLPRDLVERMSNRWIGRRDTGRHAAWGPGRKR